MNKDTFIPHGWIDKNQKITVNKMSVEYTQEADDCQANEDPQTLEISTHDAGSGTYFVIKSDRWAFDSIEEIIKIIHDFQSRLNLENEKPI
jgi:hypothetical protein